MANSKPSVIITRIGRTLKIEPATPVIGHFRTARRVAGKAGQAIVAAEAKPLIEVQKTAKGFVGRCRAGLETLLIRAHEDAGVTVSIQGASLPVLPSPAPRNFDAPFGHDGAFLSRLQSQDQLLVRHHGTRVNVGDLICQAVHGWPTCRFLVLVTTLREAERLFENLGGRRNGVALASFAAPFNGDWTPRVIVGLPGSLGFVWMDSLDFVILSRANMVCWKNVPSIIDRASRARLVGFQAAGLALSPWERDQLLQFFGSEHLSIPGHGMTDRAVNVLRLKFTGGHRLPLDATILEIKKAGIWCNSARNQRVGDLARQIIDDPVGFAREYLGLHSALANKPAPGILVVVENVDHALQLAKLLPGWRILAGNDVCLDGIPRSQRRLLQQCGEPQDGGTVHAIVTMTALPEICLSEIDVLIRADGGVGDLPIDPRQFVETPPQLAGHLLLVDFQDRHHPQLRRWTRSRFNAYEQKGWHLLGSHPVDAALRQFTTTRPRLS